MRHSLSPRRTQLLRLRGNVLVYSCEKDTKLFQIYVIIFCICYPDKRIDHISYFDIDVFFHIFLSC